MTDITDLIERIPILSANWSQDRGILVAQELVSHVNATISWDPDAGEDWAQIIIDGRARALIGIRWPVIILLERDVQRFGPHVPEICLRVVVTDLDEPELTASEEALTRTFGDRAQSAALRPSHFSAMDLWFATV